MFCIFSIDQWNLANEFYIFFSCFTDFMDFYEWGFMWIACTDEVCKQDTTMIPVEEGFSGTLLARLPTLNNGLFTMEESQQLYGDSWLIFSHDFLVWCSYFV